MDEMDVGRVTAATGYKLGKLPFRYSGVPISAKRLTISDCETLMRKSYIE